MSSISGRGVQLIGAGFIVNEEKARQLGLGREPGIEQHLRPYRNGRDLTATPRGVLVIDLFGLSAEQARERYPTLYQHVLEHVKPERDVNKRATYRDNWWIFGEPRGAFRPALAGLPRYIVTVETSKHRFFQFLDAEIAPDNMLVAIALDDAWALGALSSTIHVHWALVAGGRLGVGNDPRYNKTRCFETFPFPNASEAQQARIRELGERLDAHRKRQQAAYPALTLTNIYNVLEKLRAGEPLSDRERSVHEQGLVSVLRQLHDELDLAVLEAYGWEDLAPLLAIAHGNAAPAEGQERADATRGFEEAVLERLVALNAERTAEERRGHVRWLRPEFQNPAGGAVTTAIDIDEADAAPQATAIQKRAWPKELPDQVRAVAEVVAAAGEPLDEAAIAAHFSSRGRWRQRLPTILDTLAAIGRIRADDKRYTAS